MTTWILTIGNSDILLNIEDNWNPLYNQVNEQLNYVTFEPTRLEDNNFWTVPARALGMVYRADVLDDHYKDLEFPILTALSDNLLSQKIYLERIVFILTNQEQFSEYDKNITKCPYWKDTCTLKHILIRYFKEKFPRAKLEPLVLEVNSGDKGLDHWDYTLSLVQEKLFQLNYNNNEKVYVSHQAGTPAMSSALQFVSLARFGNNVKFVLTNEYNSIATEIIDSSKYLRGIKIEQAKKLISNSPGAAKKLLQGVEGITEEQLDKLDYFIDFFNIKKSQNVELSEEYKIESASQRIVDALDLIGIFLSQENYIQAITLLSATQETFLKVAILQKLGSDSGYLEWTSKGLFLVNNRKKSPEENVKNLQKLNFPVNLIKDKQDIKETNKNWVMLKWLKKLEPKFKSWNLLEWCCKDKRDTDIDLRNQLMHNLRGVEKEEAIEYLLGYSNSNTNLINSEPDIAEIYNNNVKVPFFNALQLFALPYTREKLIKELENLANSLN